MSLQLTSTVLKDGHPIPSEYTCDGRDISPPLSWSSVPDGTQSFALICDDPDAPGRVWVHWVLYDIARDITELIPNIPAQETLANGAKQGSNDFRRIGYGGPCPPKGRPHRYFFKLYALDVVLNLRAGATKQTLLDAMKGHVLAEAQLMGTYQRQ